jgi:hypothetical protein
LFFKAKAKRERENTHTHNENERKLREVGAAKGSKSMLSLARTGVCSMLSLRGTGDCSSTVGGTPPECVPTHK